MFEIENDILVKCNCNDDIVSLPNDIKEIAHKAFNDCKVKKIICNEGLTKICSYAFFGSKIEEIVFPTTLKYIDEYAFANCFNLFLIKLNEGLEEIGSYAFKSTKMKIINIPSSIKKFGVNPFIDCSHLIEIKVDSKNPYYTSFIDSNTICDKKTNKIISGCKKSVIDNKIEEIGDDAFNGVGLKEIIIPSGIRLVGKNSFADNSLKTINLNNVSYVYDGAFMDNKVLEKISFSNSLKNINPFIVSRCDKLDEVNLIDGIELISTNAFYNYLGTKISISKSIKVIEEKLFQIVLNYSQLII